MTTKTTRTTTDPVTLQLISNSLLYASEEMGLALRNAAYSPNIKERMDHSAAIFDREGRLLAQAEHIPVHLGSLPWGLNNMIEACRREALDLEDGSMVVSNDPYITGTHLNDVTVVAPIYHRGEPVAFAVNKAHHSDVGGKVPGSISMDARTLVRRRLRHGAGLPDEEVRDPRSDRREALLGIEDSAGEEGRHQGAGCG